MPRLDSMTNLGIVIALAARARLYPQEYELLVRLSERTWRMRTNWVVAAHEFGWSQGLSWMDAGERVARAFGLVMHQRDLGHGYVLLPTYVRSTARNVGRRALPKLIGLSRFIPHLEMIRTW